MAEFNFHACPHAVNVMLQATSNVDPSKAIKLYMLPTDGNIICYSFINITQTGRVELLLMVSIIPILEHSDSPSVAQVVNRERICYALEHSIVDLHEHAFGIPL